MEKRPKECSLCKKELTVSYTQITETTKNCFSTCSTCPFLQEHLQGAEESNTLSCPSCKTPFDHILRGGAIGCEECFTTFSKELFAELKRGKIKNHLGKKPYEGEHPSKLRKLQALEKALYDALKKENYEYAAKLRDQITGIRGG